jgi:hypothetical protein
MAGPIALRLNGFKRSRGYDNLMMAMEIDLYRIYHELLMDLEFYGYTSILSAYHCMDWILRTARAQALQPWAGLGSASLRPPTFASASIISSGTYRLGKSTSSHAFIAHYTRDVTYDLDCKDMSCSYFQLQQRDWPAKVARLRNASSIVRATCSRARNFRLDLACDVHLPLVSSI